jgi:hypothetical protein
MAKARGFESDQRVVCKVLRRLEQGRGRLTPIALCKTPTIHGSASEGNKANHRRSPHAFPRVVAIVHAVGEIRLQFPAPNQDDRRSINTNVIVKRNGEWKLTAFHNYRIQEMPRGEELTMDYGLNGRVVLISGGSRGIGKATGMA